MGGARVTFREDHEEVLMRCSAKAGVYIPDGVKVGGANVLSSYKYLHYPVT